MKKKCINYYIAKWQGTLGLFLRGRCLYLQFFKVFLNTYCHFAAFATFIVSSFSLCVQTAATHPVGLASVYGPQGAQSEPSYTTWKVRDKVNI